MTLISVGIGLAGAFFFAPRNGILSWAPFFLASFGARWLRRRIGPPEVRRGELPISSATLLGALNDCETVACEGG